jgi:hypothetical protein
MASLVRLSMAWGNKKNREREYLRTGQAASLRPGDLGSKDIYHDDLDSDDVLPSWDPEPNEDRDLLPLETLPPIGTDLHASPVLQTLAKSKPNTSEVKFLS